MEWVDWNIVGSVVLGVFIAEAIAVVIGLTIGLIAHIVEGL